MTTLTEAAAACCACLRVHWTETKHEDGSVSGRWLCTQCGAEFSPPAGLRADMENATAREEQRESVAKGIDLVLHRVADQLFCNTRERDLLLNLVRTAIRDMPLKTTPLADTIKDLRADLATAAAVTKQLQAELEAEHHLGEVSQAEYSRGIEHATARIKALMEDNVRLVAERDEAQGLCREAQARCDELLLMVPTAEQMVVLKADYERLIASLPAGPRLVK